MRENKIYVRVFVIAGFIIKQSKYKNNIIPSPSGLKPLFAAEVAQSIL